MKSNFKHTHLFLSAFFIFCFGSCWAQKNIPINSGKISIRYEEPYPKSVIFPNGKEINIEQENFAISPDSLKIALVKWPQPGDTVGAVKIYNETGTIIYSFKINFFGGLILSNEGLIIIYGTAPAPEIYRTYKLRCFDNKGNLIKAFSEEYSAVRGIFSQKGTLILVADIINENVKSLVNIYDKNLNLTGNALLNERWQKYSLPEFNEDLQEVKIPIGQIKRNSEIEKGYYFLDIMGNTKKIIKPWEKK